MTSVLNPQLADSPDRPAVPRPPDAPRRGFAWIAFAIYALVFVSWSIGADIAGTNANSTASAFLGSLAFVPLNAGAIYWLMRASAGPTVSANERSALRLLAAMYACTTIGNTVWAIDEAIRGVDPRYSWPDLFYIVSYIVGIIALARFPIAPRAATELRKFLLDAACVVLSMGALIWTFVVSPIDWQNVNSVHLVVDLAYPVGSIITLSLLCRLLMRQGPHALRSDVVWLALGLFTQCVVDLILELDFRSQFGRLTPWAALICAGTYVLLIFSAQRIAERGETRPDPNYFPVLHPMNLLPTVAAISVYVVLIWAAQSGQRTPLGVLVAAAILLNVLFLAKQTIAAQENAILQAARADVDSRTRYEELSREGQRLESVGRLAGGIAHDFNNLLTTVLANSDFALTRLRPGDTAHEEVSDIRGAAMRGAELIRQLLAFSRKSVTAPVRLQPDLVLRDMQRLLQRLAGERNALVIELPADLGMVQADRGQLEQVLANLVTNARDAMPDGGAIVVAGQNVTIASAAAAELDLPVGEYVTLSVQDSGVGIAPEVRTHIFEPFFSTKARGKGTGLGLASSYGIMRQSNGGIAVESEVGRGSRFTLYLPRVFSDVPVVPRVVTPLPDDKLGGNGETILLVEDETAVRQVTRRMLVSEGYRVLTAADADAARVLFKAHGHEISLMITDIVMPGDSGITLAASLRETSPDVAVIFVSGYTNTESDDTGGVPPDDDFVQKPFTGAQLLSRVESRLAARRLTTPSGARTR